MIDITQKEIMRNWNINNTDNPLVSIRCITYNHEPYIAQALDGFLMQKTTFPFEVIVHDDASTDKTAEIIRKYESKFPNIIKPIYEIENQWSKHDGSLRRIVNNACRGKYIAYCEGDDYWIDANKLQIQVDFLEKNQDYSLIVHNSSVITSKGEFIKLFNKHQPTGEITINQIIENWIIPTASMILKKEIVFNRPDIKNAPQGDIILQIEALDKGKCWYIDKVMSAYRWLTPGSATMRVRDNSINYWINHKNLWIELDKYYNYKYTDLICKKIEQADEKIKKEQIISKYKLLQVLRKWYRCIRLYVKKI